MMKNVVLFLAMLLPGLAVGQAPVANAPASEAQRLNAIKIYPFAFIKSRFAVSYEHAIGNRWSGQLGLGLVSNDQSSYYSGTNVFGYSADLQLRKYLLPGKDPLEGIYIAPHIGFKSIEFEADNHHRPGPWPETVKFTSTAIHGGLVMGYQMHILKVVTADVYAGGGYRHTNPNYSEGFRSREYYNSGVYPIMGLQVGVLF